MFKVIWNFRSNKVQWSLYKLYQHVTHRYYIVQWWQRCGYESLGQCYISMIWSVTMTMSKWWEWWWEWTIIIESTNRTKERSRNNMVATADATGPAICMFPSTILYICYRWYNVITVTKHYHGVGISGHGSLLLCITIVTQVMYTVDE